MNDLVDLRLHHHIAQEIYRQQMLQRLPGKLKIPKLLIWNDWKWKWDAKKEFRPTDIQSILHHLNVYV